MCAEGEKALPTEEGGGRLCRLPRGVWGNTGKWHKMLPSLLKGVAELLDSWAPLAYTAWAEGVCHDPGMNLI